ncbi:MAG: hypothetical protein WBA07_29465, partial [Rivularia sp. (in: cyanobacteria)]
MIIKPFYIALIIPLISQPVYAQLKNGLPAPSSVPNNQYPYIHSDGKVTNLKLNLLWLGCGTEDDFYSTNKTAHQALEKAGINHVWV